MNIQELKAVIDNLPNLGADNARVEFKAAERGFPKSLWETLSAFANTPGGGLIVLGVSETATGLKAVGVTQPEKFENDTASLCDQMIPPLRPLIETHRIGGRSFVTIEVPEVSFKEKPCFYKGSGMMSGSFVRVADGDRRLTQYEIQGFLDGRGQPLYDIEPVPDGTRKDLDPSLIDDFLKRVRRRHPKMATWNDEKILKTFRILTERDGQETTTLCGLLCFGEHPQTFFPGLVIHVLAYPTETEGQVGVHGERLLDDVKVEGPLLTMIPEAIAAIKKNLTKKTFVSGLLREEKWQYPELFLREAVVNALAHRDYSPFARGTAVQIKLFPSRLEISNPGGLFGPVTEERLGEHGLQASRNSFLIKLLEDAPVPGEDRTVCENRGTGIPSMIVALREAGLETPEFIDGRSQFRVLSRDHSLFDMETLAWLSGFKNIEMNEHQRYALAHLRKRGRLTNPEYCRMNDCDSRLATKELSELTERGLIIPHDARRWRSYTLPQIQSVPLKGMQKGGALRRDWTNAIMDLLMRRGEMSRKEIEEALSLKQQTVQYWLSKLIKKGRLKRTTPAQRDPTVKYKATEK
ncbi:MAG: putative DNA binding domain-containing protein [Elusimicrobia bacterium]|nr:putative DNA binding domain-containing protein [Elusimicrobiota bacterium]